MATERIEKVGEGFIPLSHITTKQELVDKCVHSSWDKKEDASVEILPRYFSFIDVLSDADFKNAVRVCRMIQRRNCFVLSWEDIMKGLGCPSKRRAKDILNTLCDVGMLIVEYPNGQKVDKVKGIVNPHIAWKGDYTIRWWYQQAWDNYRYK